jgi:hypothetical protein
MNVVLRRPACAGMIALLLALLGSQPASAAPPDAEVEGLQLPAWLVRDGQRMPLALGTRLRNGDEIQTGVGARALLRLAEGSMVKLGENARFTLNDMARKRDGAGLFTATLGVLQGAFRFTTTTLYKYRGRRDVQVQFTTVTAGIRGTDLWGKSSAERDIVALIEGEITLTRAGDAPLTMDQPRTIYQAPAGLPSLPIDAITAEQLGLYAAETEIAQGQGALGKGGRWRVYAARAATQSEALAVYDRLRGAGYPAAISPVTEQGRTVYRVRIAGLLSEADGAAVAVKLKVELGLAEVTVSLN